MVRQILLLASASPLLVALVACGDSMPMTDGGIDFGTDLGEPDLGPPDLGLMPSELYGPCVSDEQCPGPMPESTPGAGICRRASDGPPLGFCTLPCTDPTDDLPCNDSIVNRCADIDGDGSFFCERRCVNGIDCGRENYTCVGYYPDMSGICVGVCDTDDDCGDGAVCSSGGRCTTRHTSGGAANGEACANATACASGGCILPLSAAPVQPNFDGIAAPGVIAFGFAGGYCSQTCIIPMGYNSTNFFSGTDLPQASC